MNERVESLQALLARTGRGEHDAFAEIYRRTNAHLFGLALRMLRREQAAEDVLQEAFVSVWKNADGYRSHIDGREIAPMTWLIAIVRNKALDALRAQTRRRESQWSASDDDADDGSDLPDDGPGPMELLTQAAVQLRIDGCLGELDGTYRQSLALAYYQGMSHTEIATHLGAPLGSVKAWIRRGLDKLKSCLAAAGVAT